MVEKSRAQFDTHQKKKKKKPDTNHLHKKCLIHRMGAIITPVQS